MKNRLLIFLLVNSINFVAYPQSDYIKDYETGSYDYIKSYEPWSFCLIKYKGLIGSHPITMFLIYHEDKSIDGCYYYDHVGKFIKIARCDLSEGILLGEPFDEDIADIKSRKLQNEVFELPDSFCNDRSQINGWWTKNDKKMQFSLKAEPDVFNWKVFTTNSISYNPNSEFHTQKEYLSFIFPCSQSAPLLNKSIVSSFLGNGDENLIYYLNSCKSKSITMFEHFGVDSMNYEGCWAMESKGEVIYYDNSILTYKVKDFQYCNNGNESENIFSIQISNGKMLGLKDIVEADAIDSVFSLLKGKYHEEIAENSDENSKLVFSGYSQVFLGPKGIYFRERLFKLAPYINLYLSFNEIRFGLTDELKKIINAYNN